MDAQEVLDMPESDKDSPFELEEIDHVILDFLQEGARTQAYMVDESDQQFQRHHFRERFKILVALGYIEKIHDQTALYQLVHDPREDDNNRNNQGGSE
jgi:hypothetical protein